MKRIMSIIDNNQGVSLIAMTIMLLAILTVIGLASIRTSTVDMEISTNAMLYKQVLYGAETAIELQKVNLTNQFQAQGNPTSWNFALQGITDDGVLFARSVAVGADLGNGVTYNASIYDNTDEALSGAASATNDTDRMIFLRVTATHVRGGSANVELLLFGAPDPTQDITGYTAQEGGGAGKNYNANDASAISDFTMTSM